MSPWRLDRAGRTLSVDLTDGLDSHEWERLLAGILHEVDAIDAVVLVASPALLNTPTLEVLLETLAKSLERRGLEVHVERSA